ncbi:Ig-like domain-containing protein [Pseudomonas stutzeri]|nr:Ig-like domain-containing protein [Stutzerimonas stutzeri]
MIAADGSYTYTPPADFHGTDTVDYTVTDGSLTDTATLTQGGSIVIAADGSYTYTPPADFHGTDTVDYTVTDGSLTDTATLTPVPPVPLVTLAMLRLSPSTSLSLPSRSAALKVTGVSSVAARLS